jgi:hypothetical protein
MTQSNSYLRYNSLLDLGFLLVAKIAIQFFFF